MSTSFDRAGKSTARDTLSVEQFPNGPLSKGGVHEKVARRRYQKPTPQRRGKHWTILVREDVIVDGRSQRKLNRVTLGPAKLSKTEAERLRDHHLAAINHHQVGVGGACLFRDFVGIYERDVLPTLASTTQERTRSVLKNHLVPEFGDFMLRELTLEKLQGYYMRLQGSKLSAESIDKVRDVHSAVMRTAVDYGRLDANPLEKIRLKRRRLNRAKPFLRVDQFFLLVEALAEPYASMVYVAGFTGLRFSELAGLQWRNIGDGSISIDQRYARGDWDEPKSHASRATIPVDQHVLDRIHRLKTLEVVIKAGWAERRYPAVKSSGPDDLVFQSVKDGSPMRDNNVLSKHIKPAASALGFGWVNWQVLRRSCATWLQQAGVDVKDAQGLLRHSRASTTQDIYQQIVAESQHRAVRKLTTFVQQGRSVQ
ncbi:MAG: tyrosine-type recombinase/integrase family protein [Bryobacterales bacterium]|nr:tyrosine-type recombinase/integrase family protein [Bryobacterales bacterium]